MMCIVPFILPYFAIIELLIKQQPVIRWKHFKPMTEKPELKLETFGDQLHVHESLTGHG